MQCRAGGQCAAAGKGGEVLGAQTAVGGAVRVEGVGGRSVLAQVHGGEGGGVGRGQHMGQAGAGCREVRAQQIAEVVVGDAGEQRRGDSESAETGGDVEAGAARARLERGGAVGRAGGVRSTSASPATTTAGWSAGSGLVLMWVPRGRRRQGRGLGLGCLVEFRSPRDRLTISLKRFSRKMC